jgi:hypothetical protein
MYHPLRSRLARVSPSRGELSILYRLTFGGRDSGEPSVRGPTRSGTAATRRLREDQGQFQAHLSADADTHLRVALFALPIFVGFGAQNADRHSEFFRKTRRYLDLHKGFCRPVLAHHPTVYHHTPDIGIYSPAPWCVLEYAAPNRTRGYAGVFQLAQNQEPYLLRLRGVDRAARYQVTLVNSGQTFSLSGNELANGLSIPLDAALTSELILYQRK